MSVTVVVLVTVAVAVVAVATLFDEGSVRGSAPSVASALGSPDGGAASSVSGEAQRHDAEGSGDAPAADGQASEPTDPGGVPEDASGTGPAASLRADVTDAAADPSAVALDEDTEPVFDVEAQQQRLRELGYLIGPVDGRRGQQTVAAIMAFQRVHGLTVDGVVGPQTLGAFAGDPVEPTLATGPPTRIEIDLDRQLLHVVEDGERVVTLHVSSGNGVTYRTASGGWARGRTPVGEFTMLRRIHGTRVSRLGTLYDPLYFYAGFAIHGSNSVPPHPASHGCVRVSRADARWLIDRIETGTPIHLYGGTHVFTPSR